MFETLVSFTLVEHMSGHSFVPPLGPMGYSRVLSPQRRPYRTRDGYLALLPYTDAQWGRFFALAERPDLAADARYVDAAARARHFDELYQDLADIVALRGTQEWLALLAEADIPHSPVNTPEALFDDPHLNQSGGLASITTETGGETRVPLLPLTLDGRRLEPRMALPPVGAQSATLLAELGYTPDDIDRLLAAGVVAVPKIEKETERLAS